MNDKLSQVFEAISSRSKILPPPPTRRFTLISYSTFGSSAYARVRRFQYWVRDYYFIHIPVVGGGYGCTQLHFEIVADSAELAASFVRSMIRDESLHEKMREVNFRILIIDQPYTRIDLSRGTLEGGEGLNDCIRRGVIVKIDNSDRSVNINAPVTNSNLAAHSEDVSQSIAGDPKVYEVLNQMMLHAESSYEITKKQYAEISGYVKELKEELAKPKQDIGIIERIIGNLGSIASISGFVDRIIPFLPAIG